MDLKIFNQTTARPPNEQLEMVRDLLQYTAKELSSSENTEMSLTFVNNPEIKKLDAWYCNVDRATDVLSFVAEEAGDETPTIMDPQMTTEIPVNFGDLFISTDKVAEQAKFLGHLVGRELGFLAVHGFPHLDGYDHEEPADEEKMFKLQRGILDGYGLTR